MNYKKEIIRTIQELSGRYSYSEIFSDWVKSCALTISNCTDLIHGQVWKEREKNYIGIMQKYNSDERKKFVEMLGLLTIALEEITDVLGQIYMDGNIGSKITGQFFTPFHISELCAKTSVLTEISEEKPFHLYEPSSGSGGMIIAAIKTVKKMGKNPQRCMEIRAQDLDWRGVYMTYTQLSLLGVKATVIQGDSLARISGKSDQIFYTPAKKGLLLW